MRITIIAIFVGLSICITCTAELLPPVLDSIATMKIPTAHWKLTGRIHSQGIFTFGGRLGSENPTIDVNFTYDRKKWGLLFFKGQDLVDHSTFYNFALVALYKNVRVTDKITITPYVGSFLEQANSIADHGSDVVCILTTTVRINQRLSLEEMSLLGNLIIEPNERDWVNRFRLTYSGKHLDIIPTLWHNNSVFDHSSYWSGGLNVAYGRIAVADHLYLSAALTGLVVIQTSDETANPKKNALMFTMGLQWVR